ncbi:MAG TPA: long-chain-fatty-acid--CoA ligase [Egibacteraceae bacterium]
MNVAEMVARSAFRHPRRDAVVDPVSGRRLTFATLDKRVARLAEGLLGLEGVSRGDRVAILARNAAEYVELLLAAGRSGLIAQPLNWRLALDELARVVADGDPRVVVCSRDFASEAEALQQRLDIPHWLTFAPGEDSPYEDLIARASGTAPIPEVGDDDPFFILYTGGTTGVPKGALHTHRSAFACMVNQTVGERIAPGAVYLLLGQMFHIPVVLALNFLTHGAPLVLLTFDAKAALAVIEQERVTNFLGITTMLNHMMAVPDFDSYDLSSLRLIQYGGGPMPEAVVREALARFPCELTQGYGQTEGGTMTFLPPEAHREALAGRNTHRLRSCGLESYLTSVRVVDPETGQPVPRDRTAVGEIAVRSEANMAGYWRKPDLTAETLRDGWLWTGDLATWDEDGFVYIVDRRKDMIITGGENVYPAQVEAALHRHPAVLEAAVFGVPDDEWGESVKAVVVLREGMTATEQELIDLCRRHLASYMKPRSIDFVRELPKSPTGKVLKRELRAPYWEGRERRV